MLAALHDFPAAQAFIAATGAVKEALPPTEESLPPPENPSSFAIWLAGLVIVLAGAGTLAFMVEYNDQQMKANQIDQAIRQWQGGMRDLAAQPESKLPPEPTDPKPFLASPGSILYPPTNALTLQQQQEVNDIIAQLTKEGIAYSQSEIENLVALGYDSSTIIAALKTGKAPVVSNVKIVDSQGNSLGEFDEIDLINQRFIEDKSATGLNVVNPRTGRPQQTPEQWARRQIFDKTVVRIDNFMNKAVGTIPEEGGTRQVPSFDNIKGIRTIEFRITSADPALQNAVEAQIKLLQARYPSWNFVVVYGS